jgi:hypothetical protein
VAVCDLRFAGPHSGRLPVAVLLIALAPADPMGDAMQNWTLALLIIFISASIAGAEQPATSPSPKAEAQLFGERREGEVRLLWAVQQWGSDQIGFVLCRRPQASSDRQQFPWEQLSPAPIVPQVSLAADLGNVEPDPLQRERLRTKLRQQLSDGIIRPISADEYRRRLTRAGAREFRVLRRELFMDFDLALLKGFGAMDRHVGDEGAWEYGLFEVRDDGKIGEEPLAVFAPLAPNTLAVAAAVAPALRTPSGVKLRWSLSQQEVRRLAICGFNVYRRTAVSQQLQLVTSGPLEPSLVEGDRLVWAYRDDGTNVARDYLYDVRPVTAFGSELRGGDEIRVAGIQSAERAVVSQPDPLPVELPAPELAVLEQVAEGMQIQWRMPADHERYVEGFVVERAAGDSSFEPVATTQPATSRQYVDRSPAADLELRYRIRPIGTRIRPVASEPLTGVFRRYAEPPAPQKVTARVETHGGERLIRVTWSPPSPEDDVTASYVLFEKDSAGTSVPVVETSDTQLVEVYVPATDKAESIEVAGRNPAAVLGPRSVAKVDSGNLLPGAGALLAPTELRVVCPKDPARPVELHWVASNKEGVAGYRVYLDTLLLADERSLQGGASSWSCGYLKQGREYKYRVQAVGLDGTLSPLSEATNYRHQQPDVPTAVAAHWREGSIIEVTWKSADPGADVAGYIVEVNDPSAGSFLPAAEGIVRDNVLAYTPKASSDRAFTFRVRGVNATGQFGAAGVGVCLPRSADLVLGAERSAAQ